MSKELATTVENHGGVGTQNNINIETMAGNIVAPNVVIQVTGNTVGGILNLPNADTSAICHDYYNLFVIGEETFADGHFTVRKDRALTESMSDETKRQFSSLSPEAIARIKNFPSIFASENHDYGRTDLEHKAYFGYVKKVKIQDTGIKIYFEARFELYQQRLNELADELSISNAPMFNEFNRTHWAIKQLNLIEELQEAGMSVT